MSASWSYAAAAAAACVFTEFFGYWLHILLHSEKIEFLSRNHMIHHLVVYGPNMPQRRANEYLQSTFGRANVLGIGLEWLAPAAVVIPALLLAFKALGLGPALQATFIAVSLAWGFFMFGYMHDTMHVKGFWMERSPLLGRWFLRARKRHDIHHMDLDDFGRMHVNYGICFFAFDALFGTLQREHVRFNQPGFEAAKRRYAFIWELPEVKAVLAHEAEREKREAKTPA